RQKIDDDPELALLYLALLTFAPAHPAVVRPGSESTPSQTLLEDVRVILRRWPTSPEIVLAANACLITSAERIPMDEPPLNEGGPALEAASAAKTCFDALDPEAAKSPAVGGKLLRSRGNALRLASPEHDADAQEAFCRAVNIDSDDGEIFFDLGLLHKWRGRFPEALDAFLRARARLSETRAVQWNIAI